MVRKKKEVKVTIRSPEELLGKARHFVHDLESGKKDISILTLLHYNLIFFIPLLLFLAFALKIGSRYSGYFEASPWVVAKILMVPFMLIVFFFIIPFIRDREKIAGIRYSILAFLIIGVGVTLPSAIKGDYGFILMIPVHFASYILLTFIFCPEVLGIERTIRDWFKRKKQLTIIFIYLSIVLLYLLGFGALYYDIYNDPANPSTFSFAAEKSPSLATFVYYSMVSFSTTGYGDILPVSAAARLVFFMESLLGLVINVLFIAILLVFISNAEFLSQGVVESAMAREVKAEEKEIRKEEKEMRKEEQELRKEMKAVKKVEHEVEEVEKEESFLTKLYRKLNEW
jgi:voltage-gated potassium channel